MIDKDIIDKARVLAEYEIAVALTGYKKSIVAEYDAEIESLKTERDVLRKALYAAGNLVCEWSPTTTSTNEAIFKQIDEALNGKKEKRDDNNLTSLPPGVDYPHPLRRG